MQATCFVHGHPLKGSGVVPDFYLLVGREAPSVLAAGGPLGYTRVNAGLQLTLGAGWELIHPRPELHSPVAILGLQQNGGGNSDVAIRWLDHLPMRYEQSNIYLSTSHGYAPFSLTNPALPRGQRSR